MGWQLVARRLTRIGFATDKGRATSAPNGMLTTVRLILCFACAATAAVGAGGCTTAAVVSAGTVAGLAASAVSTGAEVYRLGKLDSADEARFDEWIDAVRIAADDLHLQIAKESDERKGEWRCTLVDERKSKIKVTVQRRTETLCRTRIDVGWFGSEPTARLLLAQVRLYIEPEEPDEPPYQPLFDVVRARMRAANAPPSSS